MGGLVCLVWIYLAFGRKGFWRIEAPPLLAGPRAGIRVAAVIPARDEAETIGRAARSLAAGDYPVKIYVVDDHSTDGTGELAGAIPGVTVVPAPPLERGWTGKLWAVASGIAAARGERPDYYLLTDADIEHAPNNLSQLVAWAELGKFDMVSLMVKLRCESFAEKALIPAFVFFFFKLYPPGPETSGAAGGCMLVRREALERVGGIARIRGELIDDCALAREVKNSGGKIWLGVTRGTRSLREYPQAGDVERMIARTAYTQLNYSLAMLWGAILGMTVTYLLPPILAVTGNWLGAAAWALMTICYVPILRFYGLPVWRALTLPLVALFYTGATVHSAVQNWTGSGGMWKGRAFPGAVRGEK